MSARKVLAVIVFGLLSGLTASSGLAQDVDSAALGSIKLVGQPFTLSRTPSRLVKSAPEYGEHTDEILAEFGYSSEDIARFRQAGTI